MSYDLLIKNGTLVDGTGSPGRRADVAVLDGRIAAVGKVTDGAKRTIDAADLIVAPGFIDPHTHYDAQICWDPYITSSSWHGVTTVIMGNCGVGIAPCRPKVHEIATWDLVNVEGIPFDVLNAGITWEWETYPQYLDFAARCQKGINLAFIAPLTPFRHYVMGEASMERAANAKEIAGIKALIKEAVAAGAFGFSTSIIANHIGYQGRPLASRNANRDEYKAYANALKELGQGIIELPLLKAISVLTEDESDLLNLFLTESGRPVTWLGIREDRHAEALKTLTQAEPFIKRGGVPQVGCRPIVNQINLRRPFTFAYLPCWKPAFNQTQEVQEKLYRDPEFRNAFRAEVERPGVFQDKWKYTEVYEVANPAMKHLVGRPLMAIAKERGTDAVDTFLDLALEDRLALQYMVINDAVSEHEIKLFADHRVLLGISDAGAHVDLSCNAGQPTYLLGKWVREEQALSLEYAVKKLTSEVADLFGIKQRGRIAAGKAADVTVFDPATVGSGLRGEMRTDLPGGGRRLVMPSQGIEYTIVNGEILYEHNQPSGAMPGTVLRSGQC